MENQLRRTSQFGFPIKYKKIKLFCSLILPPPPLVSVLAPFSEAGQLVHFQHLKHIFISQPLHFLLILPEMCSLRELHGWPFNLGRTIQMLLPI